MYLTQNSLKIKSKPSLRFVIFVLPGKPSSPLMPGWPGNPASPFIPGKPCTPLSPGIPGKPLTPVSNCRIAWKGALFLCPFIKCLFVAVTEVTYLGIHDRPWLLGVHWVPAGRYLQVLPSLPWFSCQDLWLEEVPKHPFLLGNLCHLKLSDFHEDSLTIQGPGVWTQWKVTLLVIKLSDIFHKVFTLKI
mgnify:CR=1 FL=1